MKKSALIALVVVLAVVVAGGAFYGGMVYGKNQSATKTSFGGGNFQGMRGNRNGANGGSFISGDIISKDSNSITLQLPNNNGSKIIFYSGTTQIGKFTSGTADDLSTGTAVSVTGTTNSDGSITAQSIQIRPQGMNPNRQGQNQPQ